MMKYRIFCIYASLRHDPAPWLLAAEDEYTWEGDPVRCEAAFNTARALAERNDWEVREVTLTADIDAVRDTFLAPEVLVEVEETLL